MKSGWNEKKKKKNSNLKSCAVAVTLPGRGHSLGLTCLLGHAGIRCASSVRTPPRVARPSSLESSDYFLVSTRRFYPHTVGGIMRIAPGSRAHRARSTCQQPVHSSCLLGEICDAPHGEHEHIVYPHASDASNSTTGSRYYFLRRAISHMPRCVAAELRASKRAMLQIQLPGPHFPHALVSLLLIAGGFLRARTVLRQSSTDATHAPV